MPEVTDIPDPGQPHRGKLACPANLRGPERAYWHLSVRDASDTIRARHGLSPLALTPAERGVPPLARDL